MIARYGLGASVRAGITLGRSGAVLGLGIIGQFALRCLLAAGTSPVVGIDAVAMRREAALAAGADSRHRPRAGDAEATARGVPRHARGGDRRRRDRRAGRRSRWRCRLACDGGQVVVVGSPRGQGEGRELLRRPAPPLHRGDRRTRQHALRAGPHAAGRRVGHQQGAALAACGARGRPAAASPGSSRTPSRPEQLGAAYEGLLKKKDEYLGVLVKWV